MIEGRFERGQRVVLNFTDAIMFGDRLNLDQCQRLVLQLRKMRFPFMCAHGRPSMVPVVKLEEVEERGRRKIDWAGWKMRSGR